MPGTLFVVATPIGNLEDFTFRGVRTLREVDLIAAEDTRRTAKLLAHYEIQKPVVSLREHNEVRESTRLVARMLAGENIALVSDAGTPGIADPGGRLVGAARAADIRVVPIPGANGIAAARGKPCNSRCRCGLLIRWCRSSCSCRDCASDAAPAEHSVCNSISGLLI